MNKVFFYTSLDFWGLFFCILGMIWSITCYRKKVYSFKYLAPLFAFTGMILLSDGLFYLYEGEMTTSAFYIVRIAKFSDKFFCLLLGMIYISYIRESIEGGVNKYSTHIIYSIGLAGIILTIYSQFTGFLYYFDAKNVFRDNHMRVSHTLMYAIFLWGTFTAIYYRKRIDGMRFWMILSFDFLVIPAIIIQSTYHFSIVKIALCLSVFMLFSESLKTMIVSLSKKDGQIYKQEVMIKDMQIKIMLSQIRPHFLFNCLNTIYYLCGKDPKMAQVKIGDFSEYLRGNLNSLELKKPIAFHREWEYVLHYLSLEQMRFGDELVVENNIEEERFYVPALTLQIFVENAIKHGLAKKKNIGKLKIETKSVKDYVYIIVEDNGVGFDTDKLDKLDEGHIGINNAKERLKMMCNGEVDIESEIGKGTKVTIKLPQKNK